ncbi:hypothetical protein PHYSODRAFT_501786, partial [Phytophthora sojae]
NSISHLGLQSTSRVEGYHAAMKLWLRNATSDLLTIYKPMVRWWTESIEKHEHAVSSETDSILTAFRKGVYEDVVLKIHNHALKSVQSSSRT